MQEIIIKGNNNTSRILIGESINNLNQYTPTNNVVAITDTNVYELYKDKMPGHTIVIGISENIKTIKTVEYIYNELIKIGVDRSWHIVGIGGGIVCDITGFVASTFMRSLSFGFVSSTLLSQVDASVGGKNGVNFEGYKNMIGTFNQPEYVICDIKMLNTLEKKEIYCGLAEIIKHALIADADKFNYIEKSIKKIINLDTETINHLITKSVEIKSLIVNIDEKEKGERKKLNFGHTYGHAIEKMLGFSHGEAVAIGMVFASELSYKTNKISLDDHNRIVDLIKSCGLPTTINTSKKDLYNALLKDKKKEGDSVHFILLNAIGKAVIEKISFQELKVFIQ